MAGKIFRIAHLGILDELDVLSTIAAIELVLVEMQQPVKLGSGVAAASRVLADVIGGKIETALGEVETGNVASHEEVKRRLLRK